MIGKRKSKSPANGLFLLVAFFSAVFLTSHLCWSKAQSQSWCKFPMQESNPKKLGPMDFYVGYLGFIAPAKKGEKVVVHSEFPHCRFLGIAIYDENFMLIDSIADYQIKPKNGINPFLAGVKRDSDWLGEFELKILMEAPPKGKRPPNTLYAGFSQKGKRNRFFILGYRIYLQDARYQSKKSSVPLGGVSAPQFVIYNQKGEPYCPNPMLNRLRFVRAILGNLWKARSIIFKPNLGLGCPQSPPIWINMAEKEAQSFLAVVPNPYANYIVALVDSKFGELLVLRFKPPQTPIETYQGAPFPQKYDMRYYSISFNKIDHTKPFVVYGEKTIADVDFPRLPDGTVQLVVGFGGMSKPDFVPEEQWVGLKMKKGLIVVRSILPRPDYPGNFWKLPKGKIPPELDKYTPGGVYCSTEELRENPDIGLRRAQLLKAKFNLVLKDK